MHLPCDGFHYAAASQPALGNSWEAFGATWVEQRVAWVCLISENGSAGITTWWQDSSEEFISMLWACGLMNWKILAYVLCLSSKLNWHQLLKMPVLQTEIHDMLLPVWWDKLSCSPTYSNGIFSLAYVGAVSSAQVKLWALSSVFSALSIPFLWKSTSRQNNARGAKVCRLYPKLQSEEFLFTCSQCLKKPTVYGSLPALIASHWWARQLPSSWSERGLSFRGILGERTSRGA